MTLGPWFLAAYTTGECSDCSEPISAGDEIRADGHGGYLCAGCGDTEDED